MWRPIVESLSLFLAPFVLFAVYLALRLRYPLAIEHWTRSRVATMILVGLAAALIGIIVMISAAPRSQGVYVPAHIENGALAPGHFQ